MNCSDCGLSAFRKNIVPGRGEKPADILFIGEAPGKTEDLLAKAFVGPAGKILNAAIEKARALAKMESPPSFYITNTVWCRPCDEKGGPNRPPTSEEAWACWPNLERCYYEVAPTEVVFLGKVSKTYNQPAFPWGIHLVHPAYILRQGGEGSTEFRAMVRQLTEIFIRVKEGK